MLTASSVGKPQASRTTGNLDQLQQKSVEPKPTDRSSNACKRPKVSDSVSMSSARCGSMTRIPLFPPSSTPPSRASLRLGCGRCFAHLEAFILSLCVCAPLTAPALSAKAFARAAAIAPRSAMALLDVMRAQKDLSVISIDNIAQNVKRVVFLLPKCRCNSLREGFICALARFFRQHRVRLSAITRLSTLQDHNAAHGCSGSRRRRCSLAPATPCIMVFLTAPKAFST
jgi:hypothetical protein